MIGKPLGSKVGVEPEPKRLPAGSEPAAAPAATQAFRKSRRGMRGRFVAFSLKWPEAMFLLVPVLCGGGNSIKFRTGRKRKNRNMVESYYETD